MVRSYKRKKARGRFSGSARARVRQSNARAERAYWPNFLARD